MADICRFCGMVLGKQRPDLGGCNCSHLDGSRADLAEVREMMPDEWQEELDREWAEFEVLVNADPTYLDWCDDRDTEEQFLEMTR